MFLAFREEGARDWHSNLGIALSHRGAQHRLQFHHLFPKAVLRGAYSSREADDIANLAFIAGRTNRQIGDQPPSHYFPPLLARSGADAFAAQCIPTEANLLGIGAYKEFLAERRVRICAMLNRFLGVGP
jgi:hypothetical protein